VSLDIAREAYWLLTYRSESHDRCTLTYSREVYWLLTYRCTAGGGKCQHTSRSRKQTLTWYITCLVVNNIPWVCTNWTNLNSTSEVGSKLTASVTLVSYLWRCERGFQLTKVPHLYIGLWGYSHDVVLDCLMWAVSYDELEVHCTEDWNVARVANRITCWVIVHVQCT